MAAGSNTIVVKVGPDGKEYNLHTVLLMHHSGYFRGALSGAFKETDDGVVSLLDVDTDAFEVFVDWAYQGTLREDLEYIRHSYKSGLATACRAYVLADRLLAPSLKSALIDAYFDKDIHNLDRWYPNCRRVIHAYEHLAENDPSLRLYVDLWAISNIVDKMDAYDKVLIPDLPHAFLVHLVRRMNEVGQKPLLRSKLERKHYNVVATTHR
ncbi:unnamed protein product [Alternaria alternata]